MTSQMFSSQKKRRMRTESTRKRSCTKSKSSDPSRQYHPTLLKEEQAANHCKSQAAHYARNPEIREKQHIQVAERRAAQKLKKQQWDPPNPGRGIEQDTENSDAEESSLKFAGRQANESGQHSITPTLDQVADVADEQDSPPANIRAMRADSSIVTWDLNAEELDPMSKANTVLGTHTSPTSDKWADSQALAALASMTKPDTECLGVRHLSEDSVLGRAMLLSSIGYPFLYSKHDWTYDGHSHPVPHTAENYTAPPKPTGHAPMTTNVTATVGLDPLPRSSQIIRTNGPSLHVQIAQAWVTALNSGDLSSPTETEAAKWGPRSVAGNCCLSYGTISAIQEWCIAVWRGCE
ncbi:hypothetical protein B0H10DRAFT_1969725 [Mycena sp. CBHHK59/15]|nr:hypothetical protein B0H10DRAFT_1969725 [Mycena sp. CBHHK59/15]